MKQVNDNFVYLVFISSGVMGLESNCCWLPFIYDLRSKAAAAVNCGIATL